MAIDFFAVASLGYFPTPTPTGKARMAFASTWGCLGVVPGGGWHRWINIWGWPWRKIWKPWG